MSLRILFLFFIIGNQCLAQLIPFRINNIWGYADSNLRLKIPMLYDFTDRFENGSAFVYKDSLYHLINEKGDKISNTYKAHGQFANGFCNVVLANGQCEYINHQGQVVFNRTFDAAESFSEGLAVVSFNKTLHIVNSIGSILPTIDFDTSNGYFQDGHLMVMKQGKYHFIKKNGSLLKLADSIQIAGLFSEGLAPVYVKKQYNSLHQKMPTYFLEFIDSNGQIAMSHFVNDSIDYSEYIDIEAGFKDGKAIVKSRNELGWDYYFIDRKKRFSPLYSAAKHLGDSLFLGALGVYMSDIRIVDKDYWVMSQFQQKPLQVGQFNNGLLAFKNKEGYWGFINQSGKTVIAPKYTAINPFKNNVALVVFNGRFGFIDTKGKEYFIDR